MAVTYSTSQECFDYVASPTGSITVSTSTRPTSTALDLYRSRAFGLIYKYAQTMTDTNGIFKGMELELVRLYWLAVDKNLAISVQLTEQQISDIIVEANATPNNSSWEPGQDQLYTR
jgi:hypothetical protein